MTDAELNHPVNAGAATDSVEPVTATDAQEVARLRAERDAARAALGRREQRTQRGGPARRLLVFLLVALFALLLPLTVPPSGAPRPFPTPGSWVDPAAPTAPAPAVTAAVSNRLTDQLYAA